MIPIITEVTNEENRARAIERFRERGIILPTFAQLRDPALVPEAVKRRLSGLGLWDLDPMNLFRITWRNEPKEKGGLFGDPNFVELPAELTGVPARIVMLVGKWFPTGAHKVGAAYGCLAPYIVSGGFDPTSQKAAWPSTGNYCRGGAFDSYLMGSTAVAILPAEMSRERFNWLEDIGAEVITTPGCESNVKEIYDECWNIRRTRKDVVIFNQFAEFGNAAWHYVCTGSAAERTFEKVRGEGDRLAAWVVTTGAAGTIAAGDYLRTVEPFVKIVAAEALQCPTLTMNGFGGHRIEGIGDKHVPWIHNVRSTDAVTAIDDEDCMRILRLFNHKEGHELLMSDGVPEETCKSLPLLGISSIANLLASVKTARWYEMDENDVILTVATDSTDMYASRLSELDEEHGPYTREQAARDRAGSLLGQRTDHYRELTFPAKRSIHNLKYYTWVEQQQMEVEDLNALWSDRGIWDRIFAQPARWDEMIEEFNAETGVLERLK